MSTLPLQNHTELLPLALRLSHNAFPDPKTHQLYSAFPNNEHQDCTLADMKEAEQKTTLNSHFSVSKYKSFREAIDVNLALRSVTLRQNSNSIDFNRNRTYSIVKTATERRRTITSSDFEALPKDKGAPKEVVYSYAEPQEEQCPAESEVVQSRYVPHFKDSSLKSSRNDLRSLLSTHYHPNCSEYRHKPILPPRDKAKSYKFVKLSKRESSNQQLRINCNLFSFLDGSCNEQDPAMKQCPSAKMEPVAKPIKLKPWK